jgi:hypothetical protein
MPLAAFAFLALVFPPAALHAQGRGRSEVQTALDLDKCYKVGAPTFQRLAARLNGVARPRARDKTFSWARFELFEPVPYSAPSGYDGTSRVLNVWLKQRGKALVLGNGRLWAPREGDSRENFKDLTVSVRPGHPRSIKYSFRVHATIENGTGPNPPVTILGRDGIELQLIEHPEDKSLRLVLDPETFREHQESVISNWIKEEQEVPKAEGKTAEGKKKEAKKEPPQGDASSEITLVRSFKADERSIVVGFRRKWKGLGDQVVDGSLHIEMNPSLTTNLYYELPGKEPGKTQRIRAAYFVGGHKAQ